MTVAKMPCKVRFTENGVPHNVLYSIFYDAELCEKYKNYVNARVISYSGIAGSNPVLQANNELDSLVFGGDMSYNLTLKAGEGVTDIPQKIRYMLGTLGVSEIILNSGKDSFTYYSIKNNADYTIGRINNILGSHSSETYYFDSVSSSRETIEIGLSGGYNYVNWRLMCYPENLIAYQNVGARCDELYADNIRPIEFTLYITFAQDTFGELTGAYSATLTAHGYNDYSYIKGNFSGAGYDPDAAGVVEIDTDNKYGYAGASDIGGGDGEFIDPDSVNGAGIPDLPSVSAANLGFITIYNPTAAQLSSLSQFMWSNIFDLDTYKKLFSDPMQSIIGLGIVPVAPTVGGNKNVMFGSINSGIGMNYLSTNYVKLDCGSVKIEKYIGSFLDYDATQISLYLPYIGIHDLDPRDVIGHTIHVVYNIDVLTGACSAFVEVSGRGVMYSFNGSCITNVPLTSINFGSAIQNAVSAVCSGASLIAGMASGAAPISAMGAMGLLNSAANLAINSKPQVQRSGALGGSAGIMSIQKPYVIIQRPRVSVPNFIENYVGQTSNITMRLGDLTGFTMVEYIHLHDIPATSEELKEIETLLKAGVIL